ncbi:MAG: Sapep family Mn(2+)-dependent dipeptidase [Oscillospiraceae bacterium]|nr:Sapep family Mn(2+)-dependent dipeptidase [Oscillospiraceae bacterium]
MRLSAKQYVKENEENIRRDIARLIAQPSLQGPRAPGAPYGAAVRAAQEEAMDMLREMGFAVTDADGRIAFAQLGDSERFLGIIAHLDVVPAGDGWDSDPFTATPRDGYLVGRGTLDDKGPLVLAAYAMKYLLDQKLPLRYGVRLLVGLDEETGMSDIDYYKAHYKMPLFTFTPDAGFPVGHGEKGIYSADLVSPPIRDGAIVELSGGVASNVVADRAFAVVKDPKTVLVRAAAGRLEITSVKPAGDGLVRVEARGKAGHAGEPHAAVNANRLLMAFLRDEGVLSEEENRAADFILRATERYDGAPLGIATSDGIFTPLTIIGGMLSKKDDRLVLNVNCRYPTSVTPDGLAAAIDRACAEAGFTARVTCNSEPFYLDPQKVPAVGLMCDIYNEVTGSHEKPFVMSGGTYARHIDNAVSYGAEYPNQKDPAWVGGVHMKNEAIKLSRAYETCEIFIETLVKLQEVDF